MQTKENASSTLMTEGSIWKKIVLFALPLFLGNLFQQLYNTADSLIVGNFLGSDALAAVSSSGSLIFLMVGFFNGIALGAGVVVARYYGARQIDKLQRAIHTDIAFGLVAGVALTVIGLVLAPKMLVWMGTPADVMPNSILYFRIYFLGSIAFVMYNVSVGILQSIGDSRHPLIYLIISSLTNVVLDLLFVGVFHMGVGSAAFATILSQNGETLHNHYHGNILQTGKLMLTDAGAETVNNYCSDFTRTVPVGGRFTSRQKDVYNIVVACHDHAIDFARPGQTWKEVHINVCKVLAQGLKDLGLMKGNVDDAVAAGAHALFMPHGLGHMMGLDVHDMEGLGQVYVGYDEETRPSEQFGLASLRMGRRLQEGFVITDEPGCYFIPALIDKWRAENKFTDFLNYDIIDTYKDFGGIRLEDDVLITATGSRFLGKKHIPLTVEEVENIMNE